MKEESDMIRKEYEKKVVELETLTKVVEDTGDADVQENLNQMIKLTDEYEIAFTELSVESNKMNELAKIVTQSVLEMKKYMDTQLPSV
jgi:ABC-type ATPase with predicted acetyltransferase domain